MTLLGGVHCITVANNHAPVNNHASVAGSEGVAVLADHTPHPSRYITRTDDVAMVQGAKASQFSPIMPQILAVMSDALNTGGPLSTG